MKKINENETKYYNYVNSVFTTVTNYYNYEYLKMPIIENNNLIGSTLKSIKDYYLNNVKKGFKKYAYDGYILNDNKELNTVGALVLDVNTEVQDAELISMFYRILEELGFEELEVKIKVNADYQINKLKNYLDNLEIDYEVSSDDNNLLSYEIVFEDTVLGYGIKGISNDITYINGEINADEVVKIISDTKTINDDVKVFIIASTEEERLTALRLAQDLRWCEFKTYVDTTNKTREEQLSIAKDNNASMLVLIDNEDLKKGLITVRDNYLNEDTKVDENEIIDYIASNL